MCGPLSEPCPGPEGAVPIQRENAGSVAVTGSGFAWHAAARRWDEELFAEGSARGFIDGGDGDGDGIPSRPTVRIVSGPEIVIPSNQKDVIAPGVTTQASNNCLSSVLHENRLFLSWRTAPYHFASPKTRLFVVSAELPSGASEGSDELPDLSGDFLSSLSFEKELEISVETDLREPQLISLDSGLLVLSFFEAGRVPWKFEPQRMLRVRKTGPGVGAWSDVEEWGDRGEILWAAQVENGTVFVQSYKGQHYSTGGEMGGIFVFLNRSSDGLRFSSVVADESAKENRISEKSEEETDLVVREKTASWDGEGSESREKKETQRDDDNVPLSGRLPMSRTRDRNQTKSVAVGNGEGDQSFSFFNVRHKSVSVSHLASESTQAQGVAGQPPSKPLWKYSGGASEAPFAFDLEGNLYSVLRNEDGDGSGWGSRTVVESREKVARCIWEGDGERGCTSSLGPLATLRCFFLSQLINTLGRMSTAEVFVGNSSEPYDKETFKWTLYVRGATTYVESVTVQLHSTFNPNVVQLKGPRVFELTRRGWGVFEIPVTIHWKNKTTTKVKWMLQFDSPDAAQKVPVPAELLAAQDTSGDVPMEDVSDLDVVEEMASLSVAERRSEMELLPPADEKPQPASPGLPAENPWKDGNEQYRTAVESRLVEAGFLSHTDPLFMHGRGYYGPVKAPKVLWKSEQKPRDDHEAPDWLTASEFEDVPEVMNEKCRQLAALIRTSRKTVAYTGAGISAAVIGQAARSGQNTVGWKGDTRTVKPTFTHVALGFLGKEGLIHDWIQQNHDGLPQKAGFPQEKINEIHGSWYDPSNPVVKYSGTLHERAFPWMQEAAETADLVLVLGTSLGGLNADQVATKPAQRSLVPRKPPNSDPSKLTVGSKVKGTLPGGKRASTGWVLKTNPLTVGFEMSTGLHSVEMPQGFPLTPCKGQGGSLGSVIINLQQTEQDGKMTLRMFGKSDQILKLLLKHLGYGTVPPPAIVWPTTNKVLVPYDRDGYRTDGKKKMWLDWSEGAKIRITPGHNIQGAQQPMYMHIGASKPFKYQGQVRRPAEGKAVVMKRDAESSSFVLQIEGVQMRLGIWWLDCAIKGTVEQLPVVNLDPKFE
uniref:Uncharacterized protein n=1 Tax=Chromera velia CCMP2878 TaxID=1169474 RepID=A0A0G4GHS2_9ALVE|eukprot:Cvel_21957.t1-p1 / transcript=Cvel_21957.t1 / gene=Cvel_21957 / organism=Chromera_velia_CCMP2878 / gene_product=NAD-dependent protein deacetylase Sirt7, putative / transcript_product=NAD-dependent protein deacetylase Sirt7, putative / location=Cvel_scaffold2109:7944-20519(-) / protein_length=1102 / sequence_SO=supercontig / SO=protein_coding / is_pseudo=false